MARPRQFSHNLVIIGGGSAGLVSAIVGSSVRAKVALIERGKMGGDCLNTGCVPSKTLIRSARLAAWLRRADEFGLRVGQVEVDFAAVMSRVRSVIARIEPHDSVDRYQSLGVDCYQGEARLVSPWEVEVGDVRLAGRNIILATGAQPLVPPIDGLDQVSPMTSENVWALRELPGRLLVLGGGPIGCELAQSFARLGSRVTLVDVAERLLPREDPDVSALLRECLEADGVQVLTGHRAERFEPANGGGTLIASTASGPARIEFDRLLLALGRRPDTSGLGLEDVGVATTAAGTVWVDPYLRTSVPSILACGDVAGPYQFTHMASHQAWYAGVNALFGWARRFRVNYDVVPWATYTDPEVATVGLTETTAQATGTAVQVTRFDFSSVDRALADGESAGFIKVLTPPRKDRILGVTIVGHRAGDLLAEYVLAMTHGIGLNKLMATIHVYPTLSEINKFAATTWKKANAPAALLDWAARLHRWRRGGT